MFYNNNLKFKICFSQKNDIVLDHDGYTCSIERDNVTVYTLVAQAKKVVDMVQNIRICVVFTLQLGKKYNTIMQYWLSVYIHLYNLLCDQKKKVIFTFSDNDLDINDNDHVLHNAQQDAQLLFDCTRFSNKTNLDVHPGNYVKFCEELLCKYKIRYNIETQLCDHSSPFKAIYAIGKSGEYLPRFIQIEVFGDYKHKNINYCLVGKGVTFDTGGYNVKPWKYMLGMQRDKCGSIFAVFTSIILRLRYGIGSYVLLAIAENKISSNAICPGDIVYNYCNKAIHITHTDAEGRVILADLISYASKNIKFTHLFVFATLTGTAECIYGPDTCIFMSDSETVTTKILSTKSDFGERVWNLPIDKWINKFLKEEINGVECIKNATDIYADTIAAGMFLYNFFERENAYFTHFDLAALFDKEILENHSAANLMFLIPNVLSKL